MGTWTNADGLTIYYGIDEATKAVGGFYEDAMAGEVVLDFVIPDLTKLTSSAVDQGINMFVPCNHRLERVWVFAEANCTSADSTATLNIGFFDHTAGSTISDTGAVAGAVVTTLSAAGKQLDIITGGTAAGAKAGLVVYNGGNPIVPHIISVTAKYGVEAFSAGAVRVKLFFQNTLTTD